MQMIQQLLKLRNKQAQKWNPYNFKKIVCVYHLKLIRFYMRNLVTDL